MLPFFIFDILHIVYNIDNNNFSGVKFNDWTNKLI
ncbi:hypothetical protein [Staphylococcus aureus]|nr:hypothetical protein [Staphylococcus aureus]